jgi:hypothetical protein
MTKTDSQFAPLTRDDVVARIASITDGQLAAILASGATKEEFEEALAWADLEDDVMLAEGKRLAGKAAAIYDIITSEDVVEEDARR